MNREIKFRGWDMKSGWVYGSLVNNLWVKEGNPICEVLTTGRNYYDCWEDMIDNENIVEVESESVGQFTGLKDMNGKEIYEGDIIYNTVHGHRFVIQWGIEGESYSGWAGNWLGEDFISPLFNGPLQNCEVIGNICENPELIK